MPNTRLAFLLRLAAALLCATTAIGVPALPPFVATAAAQGRAALPTPEQFFGFRMGADRKLANWDRLLEYYRTLAKGTDRMKLVDLGTSSEGRPYIALFISSPANLARLEDYRKMNATLGDPRGVPPVSYTH